MGAPLGNKNNRKPKRDKAGAKLEMRCKATDKRNWANAAPGRLTPWVVETLNAAATAALIAKK